MNLSANALKQQWTQVRREALFTHSAYFFANTVAVSGFGFLFWWLSARLYPATEVGGAVVMVAMAQLITTIALFGSSFGLIRFLPTAGIEQPALVNVALTYVVGLALALALALIAVGPQLSPALAALREYRNFAVIFLLFVVALALQQLTYPILAALRAGKLLLATNVVIGAGRILLMSVLWRSPTLATLILAFAVPVFITAGVLLTVGLRQIIPGYFPAINLHLGRWRHVVKYSTSSYAGNVLHDLPYQLLPQIVANQAGMASAAYFFVTWNFFSLLTTLGSSISLSLFVEGSHRSSSLDKLTRKTMTSVVVTTAALALVTLLLAKPLLSLFGQVYVENGVSLLRVAALAAIPAAAVYAQVASLRVKMRLGSVIIAFALVAGLTLPVAASGVVSNLTAIGWVWVTAQVVAAVYLLVGKGDKKVTETDARRVIFAHPMDSLFPAQGGGIRYLMNALQAFVKQGWSATVIGTRRAARSEASSAWQHIAISPDSENPFLGWMRYLLLLYLRLPWLRLPGDAVIVTHRMDCMLAFVLFKPRHPKVMITATPAHYLRLNLPTLYKVLGWVYHLAERVCVSGVDYIVATDPVTRSYYATKYPKAKLANCLPSAVDLSRFRPVPQSEARQSLGWPLDTPSALFVGRLERVKNLPLLIQAFATVEQALPDARLYIVGSGTGGDEIMDLAAQQCRRAVFTGAVSPEKVALYYAAADVLVLCSLEEGSPTVVKEALACGTAVISTDVGDAAQVLAQGADLGQVVPADESNLAQALIETLAQASAPDSVREARRNAVQIYGVEETGLRLIETCKRACQARDQQHAGAII